MEKIITHELSKDFKTVEVYTISDLHIGDARTDIASFKELLKYIMAEPNRFILLAGDLINNAIKSSVSNVYEEIMTPSAQKKWIVEQLEPVRERILGIVGGNHEYRSTKEVDIDITESIADKIGKPSVYREDETLIKITFGKKGGRENKQQCYTIYLTHGAGGGKRPGSSLNNIELLGLSIDADVYIMGHTHKRMAYKSTFRRPDLRNNAIAETERLFVVSAAWQSYGGYAARKMLPPGARGSVPIILQANKKKAEAVI